MVSDAYSCAPRCLGFREQKNICKPYARLLYFQVQEVVPRRQQEGAGQAFGTMPGTPVPFCTACKNVGVLCKCENPGQEVSFAWDQPDEVTPDSKLARWLVMVQLHPRLRTLDPANFLNQYKKQGLLEAFERWGRYLVCL